jgi:hypothetical protein
MYPGLFYTMHDCTSLDCGYFAAMFVERSFSSSFLSCDSRARDYKPVKPNTFTEKHFSILENLYMHGQSQYISIHTEKRIPCKKYMRDRAMTENPTYIKA